ncbi:hypothetical protein GCM10011332_22720 [Terasakiella brassicae]|uniref:Uncharacterized protein n=1 Tax=Terasakiella brassicae TaxID=1634917 RepID=A0A917C2U5_9PROT|nr:hypothetical protein [Terasakiella brassicae]GGF68006.1 hypothetical protein GCM10011332_22720 [Terasakiella brassicae]
MAVTLETKALVPAVPAGPLRAARGQNQEVAPDTSKTQNSAQAFVNSLSVDIRNKVMRPLHDRVRHDKSEEATQEQETQKSKAQPADTGQAQALNGGRNNKSYYSSPTFIANLTVLQAQQGYGSDRQASLGAARYKASHQAYLDAGAQPGGEFNAREDSIKSAERAEKIMIVPPGISTVNFVA